MRASRLLFAVAIVLAGFCAAWPFRHSPPERPAPPDRPAPLSLTLRRPDAPLELAPHLEPSPATGLQEAPSPQPMDAGDQPAKIARLPDSKSHEAAELARLPTPPALPVSFQPLTPVSESVHWKPDPIIQLPRPASKPRPYRLRDGDTLEKIAERLLGNAQRAPEILELNRGILMQPDLLPVGVTILLPPRDAPSDLEPVMK